jgi:hypothetical protein
MIQFRFVDASGRWLPDSETQGYVVRDYFDCDLETATHDELVTAYKGPDVDGVGVLWTVP